MIKDFQVFIIPLAVFLASFTLLFAVRRLILMFIRKWAKATATNMDDLFSSAIRTPSIYWILALSLYISVEVSEMPVKYAFYVGKTLHVLIILSITITVANLSSKIFGHYVERSEIPVPATGLAFMVIRVSIFLIGALILLGNMGVSITPLLTAMGIGGLAVALAMQDTLSNFFSGIHILIEKPLRVGDFVRIETGEEGYVEDIGWRTTRIKMLPNNMLIIPNSRLSTSILTNYYLPDKTMSLLIGISVSYSSDPDMVEKILVEEAKKAVGEIPGLLEEPQPFVRFIPGFGKGSLDFTLICQIREFVDQYFAQHELRKRIFKRFRAEGIEILIPQSMVYLREEKDWKR